MSASAWRNRFSDGLARSRQKLAGTINQMVGRTADLDDGFWDELEEALIGADVGVDASVEIVERLRLEAKAEALPDDRAIVARLKELIAAQFAVASNSFDERPCVAMFVGINGTGKTTTVGKLAKRFSDEGATVVLGSADTFRAAAIEQLAVWADRAAVEVVARDRGADPAAVAFDTVARAEELSADVTIIDTAGRLHTSKDLMAELQKLQRTVTQRSSAHVFTVLVIDATTGQNGLVQAREFNRYLSIDALVLTKLDGTAKGGIAVAVSRELQIPVIYAGVGESASDLKDFDATEYAEALVGADV